MIIGSSFNNPFLRSFATVKSGKLIFTSIGRPSFFIGTTYVQRRPRPTNPDTGGTNGGGTGDGNAGGGGNTGGTGNTGGGNTGGGGGSFPPPVPSLKLLLLDEAQDNMAYSGDKADDDLGLRTLQDKLLIELNTTATIVGGYTFIQTDSGSRRVSFTDLISILEQ